MATQLNDLPDELLSIIIEDLVNSVSPEWPHLDQYHQRCRQNYKATLAALASTCKRMLNLCSSLAHKLKGQLPPALARGVWEWSELEGAAYPSPPSTGNAMTHLQVFLSEGVDGAGLRAPAFLILSSPHLRHLSIVFNGESVAHAVDQSIFFRTLLMSHDQEQLNGIPESLVVTERRCKSLKSVHFQASAFEQTASSFFDFVAVFRIEDLVIITRPEYWHQYRISCRSDTQRCAMRSGRQRWTFYTAGDVRSHLSRKYKESKTCIPSHTEEVWLPESAGGGGPHSLLGALPSSLNRLMLKCHINDELAFNNSEAIADYRTLGDYVASGAGGRSGCQQTQSDEHTVSIKAAETGQDSSGTDERMFLPVDWRQGLLDWIGDYFHDSWKQYLDDNPSAHAVVPVVTESAFSI